MNNILALVDLSSLSAKVVDQATAIAAKSGAKLTLCHILSPTASNSPAEVEAALAPFVNTANQEGVTVEIVLEVGELFDASVAVVKRLDPDLVVAGTHGMESVRQGYFGSAIHKLVKEIDGTSLVVSQASTVIKGGYEKILLPVAPHAHFIAKVEASIKLLSDDGLMILFAIRQPGVNLDRTTDANLAATKEFLNHKGVKWEYLEEEPDKHAIGYSVQTMRRMTQDGISLVSIMAQVSKRNMHFGKIDKESLLLNDQGIQVLCTNDPV